MRTDHACRLTEQVITKPGYRLTATPCDRFEDCLVVRCDYVAPDYSQEHAPAYSRLLEPSAAFLVPVGDIDEPVQLYDRLLKDVLLRIEEHEHREAFRVGADYWAPFHPHKTDGIKNWGDPAADYTFGAV